MCRRCDNMKAYITCPVSHSKERLDLLPKIKEIINENGIDSFIFEIGGNPEEIFERDYNQLKSCDLIIAEVSERSHGVGIEIGLSFGLGLKRILLIEGGNSLTKLAQRMPDTIIIEYNNLEDLKKELKSVINAIKINR